MNFVSDDQIRLIALSLPSSSIAALCQSNIRFNDLVCNDNLFWYLKFVHDYGKADVINIRLTNWKNAYQTYGSVWSFGLNDSGQLGVQGQGLGDSMNESTPTKILNVQARSVSCGNRFTALIDLENNVWKFGSEYLLFGPIANRPTQIPNIKAKFISCGDKYTMFIDMENIVLASGDNYFGQLGLGDSQNRHVPTQILNPNETGTFTAQFIACGKSHTILIDMENNVWAVGDNYFGQLGLGITGAKNIFTQIPNIKARFVSCSSSHSILIDLDNNVWSFGDNSFGQLGLGHNQRRHVPNLVPNLKAQSVACGDSHTVLIDLDNNVWSFGYNDFDQLGLGDKHSRNIPTQIPNIKAQSVACGESHTILIDLYNNAWSFGHNDYGQLGLGDTERRNVPTLIPNIKAQSIACGKGHTILIEDILKV